MRELMGVLSGSLCREFKEISKMFREVNIERAKYIKNMFEEKFILLNIY